MIENDRNPISRKREFTRLSKRRKSFSLLRGRKTKKDKKERENKKFNFSEYVKETNKSCKKNNWLFKLFLKLLFIIFTISVIIYGLYLDQKIRNRIDGNTWHLPAAVYSRIVNLEPDMTISKTEMIRLLEFSQYRQVKSKAVHSGEFTVQSESIEVIRRSFSFPDGKEGQVFVRLKFDGNRLKTIENIDNNRQFGFFRIDPRLITMLSSTDGKQRLFVERNGFPDILVHILLATEDRHFYKHDGVNFYSIGRAILANMIAGHTVQGASTLTQQLVKNLFLTRQRSYWRKINEAYMALLMNIRYSKDRILELYMNEVYLGQSGDKEIRGFPLGSLYYFGRPVEELSVDQQALLVGMVKGASIYNPWRNPKLALERRNLVLNLLKKQQIIDREMYYLLCSRPLCIKTRREIISPQPAFMQMIRQELQEELGSRVKDLSGVKIFTTFDPIAQNAIEKAAVEGIPVLKRQHSLKDLETAIVVVDRYSGEVRAMMGGAEPQYAGYNRAMQARRLIGSLAKPATYLAALSQPSKYRLNTWISDQPLFLRQPNGQLWSPQNDDHQFSGQVMLVDALTYSMNVPTVNLGVSLGLAAITDIWKKLGVPREQLYPVPAMILGAMNLTPIEVAQTFQTIASGGNRALLSSLRSVVGEDGTILYQSYPQAERAVPAQSAYMTLWIMQQVVQKGTGYQLGAEYPDLHLAGKTGTTNNNLDTWFVGIDGREVTVIWVGRDNNQPTKLYGSNGAMSIYRRYLENQFPIPLNLVPPEGIIDIGIDEMGNFICKNGGRKLPVWTSGLDVLCLHSLD